MLKSGRSFTKKLLEALEVVSYQFASSIMFHCTHELQKQHSIPNIAADPFTAKLIPIAEARCPLSLPTRLAKHVGSKADHTPSLSPQMVQARKTIQRESLKISIIAAAIPQPMFATTHIFKCRLYFWAYFGNT